MSKRGVIYTGRTGSSLCLTRQLAADVHSIWNQKQSLPHFFGFVFSSWASLTDETEYEYSGSEDEDEERDMGEPSSIINVPGESTLRRDFLRLQLANKERSEAQRRQQLEQQHNEEHKRLLLAERQKRIEEQKEQRRRLEEVRRREERGQRMFLMQHRGVTESGNTREAELPY